MLDTHPETSFRPANGNAALNGYDEDPLFEPTHGDEAPKAALEKAPPKVTDFHMKAPKRAAQAEADPGHRADITYLRERLEIARMRHEDQLEKQEELEQQILDLTDQLRQKTEELASTRAGLKKARNKLRQPTFTLKALALRTIWIATPALCVIAAASYAFSQVLY